MTVKFSIIIPFKKSTVNLYECLDKIRKQSYRNFEVILLPDKKEKFTNTKLKVIPTGQIGPAEKRDVGAEKSTGSILAFIDDDAYPDKDWLKNMVKNFADREIAAVGGPGVTPSNVSWQEQASGWFGASPFGGGSNSYRFLPAAKRFIDDYPSMNLAVRKSDFLKVGGFDSSYWPGEDTKLCLDLTYKLGKKITYDPEVLVYHHRRKLWGPHLRQNGNYGLHRGYFAKALPKTSFRLVYFLPSFIVLGLFLFPKVVGPAYGLLLLINAFWIAVKSRSLFQGLISMPVVFLTHFWYGVRFIQGFFFTRKLFR
ncbi:glycosyltransferase [Candidatus Gottesmanbacteria bacterium]|nr:glycosyltransferase [Candidatus Gottesmanbacteria bacterium]